MKEQKNDKLKDAFALFRTSEKFTPINTSRIFGGTGDSCDGSNCCKETKDSSQSSGEIADHCL